MAQKVQPIRSLKKVKQMYSLLRGNDKTGRNALIFLFGINTALRITVLLNLKYSDIFHPDCRFRELIKFPESTTKKQRAIETKNLSEKVRTEMKKYAKKNKISDEDWFFPSHRNQSNNLDRTDYWKILKKAGRALRIENLGCHSLRKTFGFQHHEKYHNLAILMKLFGHSKPEYTIIYLGIEDDNISKCYSEIGEIYDFK